MWGVVRDEVTGILDEDICPIAFLMHYSGKIPIVVVPRCGRLSCEPLYAPERRILTTMMSTRAAFMAAD